MGFLDLLRPGKGLFTDEQKATLESEGVVILEEGLSGTIRYNHFKAPGKRFHGKVVPEKMAIGVSRKRLMVFCRNGRAKLANSEFTSPQFAMLEVKLEDGKVALHVDYDKGDEPKVSGQVVIRAKTPDAARIVDAINAALGR